MSSYIVCIIDVLGQKENLKKWPKMQHQGNLTHGHIEAIKNTIIVSHKIKNRLAGNLRQQINGFKKIELNPSPGLGRAPTAKHCKISVQQFSDTLMFYSPTYDNLKEERSAILFQIITSSILCMMESLLMKCPIRGGISLEIATEIKKGNLYGPAVAEAHNLENNIANYPRIAVSKKVFTALKKQKDPIAKKTFSLLGKDLDGVYIIDYFGKGFRDVLGNNPDTLKTMADIRSVTANCLKKYGKRARLCKHKACPGKADANCKHKKIELKYKNLLAYMDSRIKLWQ